MDLSTVFMEDKDMSDNEKPAFDANEVADKAIESAREKIAKLRLKFTKPLYMGEPTQAPGSTLLTRNLRGSSREPDVPELDSVPFDPEDWSVN